MNKKTTILTSFFIAFLAFTPGMISSQEEVDEEASPSAAVEIDVIKENVKKRIESVVKGQQTTAEKRVAYIGKLESIANDTLTIDTNEGIKLASTSNQTTVANLTGNSNLSIDDLGIGDYISALGYPTESEVLEAKRIIVSNEPEENQNQSTAGLITAIDEDEETITIVRFGSTEAETFAFTKNPTLEVFIDDQKVAIKFEDLKTDVGVAIIYEPTAEEEEPSTISQLLATNIPLLEVSTSEATPSSKTDLEDIIPKGLQ